MNLPWLAGFVLREFLRRPREVVAGVARQAAVEFLGRRKP